MISRQKSSLASTTQEQVVEAPTGRRAPSYTATSLDRLRYSKAPIPLVDYRAAVFYQGLVEVLSATPSNTGSACEQLATIKPLTVEEAHELKWRRAFGDGMHTGKSGGGFNDPTERLLAALERRRAVERHLSVEDRMLVTLLLIEGVSVTAISEGLGLRRSTTAASVRRALSKLGAAVEAESKAFCEESIVQADLDDV